MTKTSFILLILNPIYVRRENYKCLDISCSRHGRHPRTQGPANSFRFYPTPSGLLPHYLIILISFYLILINLPHQIRYILSFHQSSSISYQISLFLSFYRKLFNLEVEPLQKKETRSPSREEKNKRTKSLY